MTQVVRFSRHAKNRLRLWHLTDVEVVEALQAPDRVAPSDRGRFNAWKQVGARWIRVTYVDETSADQTIRTVITVTVPKRGP